MIDFRFHADKGTFALQQQVQLQKVHATKATLHYTRTTKGYMLMRRCTTSVQYSVRTKPVANSSTVVAFPTSPDVEEGEMTLKILSQKINASFCHRACGPITIIGYERVSLCEITHGLLIVLL
jgi:hypothetical protein